MLVEWQTEEAFVNELLVPHYAQIGLYLTPMIVSTSPGYKGGVVSCARIKPQIERLCKHDAMAHVTTACWNPACGTPFRSTLGYQRQRSNGPFKTYSCSHEWLPKDLSRAIDRLQYWPAGDAPGVPAF